MFDNTIELIKEFFSKAQIDIKEISLEKDENSIYSLKIISDDSWIIIWNKWKNLDSFKRIITLLISKQTWEKTRLRLEVNDYLKEKEDKLIKFIESKISYVKESWKDIKLPFLSSYDRKKIHSFVAELGTNIYTESKWEWRERRLYICKRTQKLSIDIDWDNI